MLDTAPARCADSRKGMSKRLSSRIPYSRQWIDESDIAEVVDVLRSDFVTQGAAVEKFEEDLTKAVGVRFAVVVANGSAALDLVCAALEVNSESVGITSPITFAASANCLLHGGAAVKFADVDPLTGLMAPENLKALLESKAQRDNVRGIVIPVSLAGRVANLPEIQTIAKKYNFSVVEDAAHSLGATYTFGGNIYRSGSCAHTDAAILSFHPVKQICCGEGGAVLTNRRELADSLRLLRNHGIRRPSANGGGSQNVRPGWFYEQVAPGWNYRLSDIQAVLGCSQLARLDRFLDLRRTLAARYRNLLDRPHFKAVFRLCPQEPGHAWHLFVIHFFDGKRRDAAYEFLRERNIQTQVHYIPLNRHPLHVERLGETVLPGAEAYFRGCLSIPLFPKLSFEEQDRVVEALDEFCRRQLRFGREVVSMTRTSLSVANTTCSAMRSLNRANMN